MGRGCHRSGRRGPDGGAACGRAWPANPGTGEESQGRRQNPHVRRHALQHHSGHRQSRHRGGLRAAGQVPPFVPGRLRRAAKPSISSKPKGSPPRSRRRARSFPSATRRPTCSRPCCAGSNAAGRRWRSAKPCPGNGTWPGWAIPADDTDAAITRDKVILTTGGQSYPGSGTTGDGYRFAAQFGHRIVPPRPALVPLTTTLSWIAELRGITLARRACPNHRRGQRNWPSGAARCCSRISACLGRPFST